MTATPSPTLLVVGATGRVGRLLVPMLAARGYGVRCAARDPYKARTILPPEVEVSAYDFYAVTNAAALLAGVQGVVFVASGGAYIDGEPRKVDFEGVRQVAEAAAAQGAPMVLMSSASVTHPEHPHNCTFNSVLKWKARGEASLRASGAPYTIVRALGLRDREGGRQGVRMLQGDRLAFGEDIARIDIAAFLADVVGVHVALRPPLAPTGQGFAAGFMQSSLRSATIEIYNDATIPGERWDSARIELAADAPIQRDGAA